MPLIASFFRYEESPYESHHHHPYTEYSHAVHRAPSYRYEPAPAEYHQYHHPRETSHYPPGNSNNTVVQSTFYQNNMKGHAYKNNNNYKNH